MRRVEVTRQVNRAGGRLSMTSRLMFKPQRGNRNSPASLQMSRLSLWLLSRPFVWSYRAANRIFQLDKRSATRNLKRLKEDVEYDCKDLLQTYGGRILPELSTGSPFMDFASVVIKVRSLQLRATRDRGDTSWEISSRNSSWQPLDLVCQRFASENIRLISSPQILCEHLPQIEQFLEEH